MLDLEEAYLLAFSYSVCNPRFIVSRTSRHSRMIFGDGEPHLHQTTHYSDSNNSDHNDGCNAWFLRPLYSHNPAVTSTQTTGRAGSHSRQGRYAKPIRGVDFPSFLHA